MMTINVQFTNIAKTTVCGYASSPQSESVWPFQGEISTSDPMWAAYYDAQDASLMQPYLPTPTRS